MEKPKPEQIGPYKVVYPIYREDLAEAILIPIKNPEKKIDNSEGLKVDLKDEKL